MRHERIQIKNGLNMKILINEQMKSITTVLKNNTIAFMLVVVLFQLVLIGCGTKKKANELNELLSYCINSKYQLLFINSRDTLIDENPHISNALKLRKQVYRMISQIDEGKMINQDEFELYELQINGIIRDYGADENRENLIFERYSDQTQKTKIKILELLAINTLLKDYFSQFNLYDSYMVLPIADNVNRIMKKGEKLTVSVFLAIDNSHNPYITVLNGDTIISNDMMPPIFTLTSKAGGINEYKGEMIIFQNGSDYHLPFEGTYLVK